MNIFGSLMEILNVLFLICFVWLIVCLIKFIRSKNEPERHKRDKKFLIISVVVFACAFAPLIYSQWLFDPFSILILVFTGLPIISFICLIVYLVKFIKSAKSELERRRRIRNLLILSAFLFIIFSAVLAGFFWLLNHAIEHM
ncbi:hypothetical protein [uncultured Campylobacter sp.]|uniref:hypothetical protein n=1 Tax=uncultured Campylobacter sp. TaxID=218934 RepID=UPI00261CF766|nr:hypothetical protein [uncultured Campylobacter sp.]